MNKESGTVMLVIIEARTVDSEKLENGCSMICAGFLSFFGLGLEHRHVPTFCRLLYFVQFKGAFQVRIDVFPQSCDMFYWDALRLNLEDFS